jgi:AcrR family transcriptional regulator
MRADALQNRERLLLAARDVFVEQGADAPLDDIARRARVGIATLYRRFPERELLMRAVVASALERVAEEARRALAEEPNGFDALARYMHAALDLRVAAVIPALLDRVPLHRDPELRKLSDASAEQVQALIDSALADATLRADVTFGDIGLLIVRFSRPLPGAFGRALDASLAHRHLDVVIEGLRTRRGHSPGLLSGPALSLGDLRNFGADHAVSAAREEKSHE